MVFNGQKPPFLVKIKKTILWPITIISVYFWDELRATNGNLYDKIGPVWVFPDFGHFLLYFWLILGSKWVFSCQIPPKWPTVINVFIWDQLVPLSTILVNINTSGWTQMIKMHFLEFLVFLQKTLAAHISAPRRGKKAVQYSRSSSGGPLC